VNERVDLARENGPADRGLPRSGSAKRDRAQTNTGVRRASARREAKRPGWAAPGV